MDCVDFGYRLTPRGPRRNCFQPASKWPPPRQQRPHGGQSEFPPPAGFQGKPANLACGRTTAKLPPVTVGYCASPLLAKETPGLPAMQVLPVAPEAHRYQGRGAQSSWAFWRLYPGAPGSASCAPALPEGWRWPSLAPQRNLRRRPWRSGDGCPESRTWVRQVQRWEHSRCSALEPTPEGTEYLRRAAVAHWRP
jgi:hypothetical protein